MAAATTIVDVDNELIPMLGTSCKKTDIPVIRIVAPMVEGMVESFLGYRVAKQQHVEYHPTNLTVRTRDDNLVDGYELVAGKVAPRGTRSDRVQNVIALTHVPVRSIVDIRENSAAWDAGGSTPSFPSNTIITDGIAYRVDWKENDPVLGMVCKTGLIFRRAGAWAWTPRSVQVTYVAGYTSDELDKCAPQIKLAVIEGVAHRLRELAIMRGGSSGIITAEAIDGWSTTYAAPNLQMTLGGVTQLPPSVLKMLEPFKVYRLNS